jgi:hypothetical protein
MPDEYAWVIRDQRGHFVNVRKLKKGHYYTTYDGITTGFAYYNNEEIMKRDLELLGIGFCPEYINLRSIANGVRIYSE